MNFDKSIFTNKQKSKIPFLAAHRGVNRANIPCNSLLSFRIALMQGADVVEIDVAKSKDGDFFVFHPDMEHAYLDCGKLICDMTSEEVKNLRLLNCDRVPTSYRIPTLQEVFALLKGKCYINVDKFWTDIEGITNEIRKAGVERQVIVKTPVDEPYIAAVEKYAPDLMFMALAWHKDDITEKLLKRNINYIGIEALFDQESDEICSREYIDKMHDKGFLVWVNSIVYNESDVISAGHTDDSAFAVSPEHGWGWIADIGADFMQTDWLSDAKAYFACRK